MSIPVWRIASTQLSSGMEHHPLNPMLDASVVRLLRAQSDLPVGLVPRPVVAQGAGAIAPGVPWTEALSANGERRCWLALKSGNFGGPDFFHDALKVGGRE